jgi:hypothetical protein
VGVWLFGSLWLGWKRGIVRQAASLIGLALASAAGFWLGPLISPIIPALGLPSFLRPLLGGILLGLIVWAGVSVLATIVFRKTEDQGLGMIRLFYGVSGAALGLLTGLFVLALGGLGIRFFGTFAEGLHTGSSLSQRGKGRGKSSSESPPLVSLKKALEESAPGRILGNLDPLPDTIYPRLQKLGQILTNSTARERLLSDPSMEAVSKNPKLLALKNDAELQEAMQSGDVWAVFRNAKIQSAASDAQLLTALRTIDLDKALERALSTPVSGGLLTSPRSTEKIVAPHLGAGRSKP